MEKSKIIEDRFANPDEGHLPSHPRVTIAMDLLRSINFSSTPKILDVGCRDGTIALEIKKTVPGSEVMGIEISEKTAALARKKGIPVKICIVDEAPFPFEKNSFDVVYAGEIIEYLYDTDHFLEQIRLVLKPGGYLLLSTPNLASWHNRFIFLPLGWQPSASEVGIRRHLGRPFIKTQKPPPGHIHLFVWRSLKELLGLHSFTVEKCRGVGITEFPLLGYIDKFFAAFIPSMAAGFVVKARLDKSHG